MTDRGEIERLAAAATPGPWYAAGGYVSPRHPDSPGFSRSIYHLDELGQETPQAPYQAVRFANWNDAAFIAAARTAVPELLTALDAATTEIERLRTALKSALIEVQRFHHALRMNGNDFTAAALAPAIAIASAALSPRPAVTQDEMDDCYQGGTRP